MNGKDELRFLIALKAIPLVGDIVAKRLIETFGSAADIFSLSVQDMLKTPGVGKTIADLITKSKNKALSIADKELEFLDKNKIEAVHIFSNDYPFRLSQCIDAPLYFFYRGKVNLQAQYVLSVVGTRNSTVYGRNMCNTIITDLQLNDIQIVSGLAYGIDTAAHTAAVENNIPTIAVLGHGLKTLYPPENRSLAEKILENGALITEFLSWQQAEKEHFPIRNRIIAGLADATLVVEARTRGGALITAEIANSYNRDVFAVPGRVGDKNSQGCNWLIRTNRAVLIENAEQLKYQMNWLPKTKPEKQLTLSIVLDANAQKMYDFLRENGECHIDKICRALDITMSIAAGVLLELEFQGIIAALPGKRFVLSH